MWSCHKCTDTGPEIANGEFQPANWPSKSKYSIAPAAETPHISPRNCRNQISTCAPTLKYVIFLHTDPRQKCIQSQKSPRRLSACASVLKVDKHSTAVAFKPRAPAPEISTENRGNLLHQPLHLAHRSRNSLMTASSLCTDHENPYVPVHQLQQIASEPTAASSLPISPQKWNIMARWPIIPCLMAPRNCQQWLATCTSALKIELLLAHSAESGRV